MDSYNDSKYNTSFTEVESALDLTCRTEEQDDMSTSESRVDLICSPILMPLPQAIPAAPPIVKFLGKKQSPKIFKSNTDASSELRCTVKDPVQIKVANTFATDKLPADKHTNKDHCSVPVSDVRCYFNNNINIDNSTKNNVHYQIQQQMYSRQQQSLNVCQTPKKCAEDFRINVTEAIKSSGTGLKMNMEHFHQKKLNINEIEVDSLLQLIRCSTPTNLDASTILAGHFDCTIDEMDVICNSAVKSFETDSDDSLNKYLNSHVHDQRPKETKRNLFGPNKEKEVTTLKMSYCQDWMRHENGISMTNTDPLLHCMILLFQCLQVCWMSHQFPVTPL